MKKIQIIIGAIALVAILYFSLFLLQGRKSVDISEYNLQDLREIAWKSIEENQLKHITNKKEEAKIELIESKGKWIVPITDEQKMQLENIKEKNSILITVTFSSDQDGLLGPIVPIINPKTMKVIGFYPRY